MSKVVLTGNLDVKCVILCFSFPFVVVFLNVNLTKDVKDVTEGRKHKAKKRKRRKSIN